MVSKELQEIVEEIIGKTFNVLRLNLLGPERVNKAYVFSFKDYDPNASISSIYAHANAINTTSADSVDKNTVNRLQDVAEKYIDHLQEKTSADILRVISDNLAEIENESKIKGVSARDILLGEKGEQVLDIIKKELEKQKERIDKSASILAEHELYNAQNYGAFDGVLAAARSVGISDPTVIKIGVLDSVRCSHCWRLWTLPDRKTPKAYKLSELAASPGNWKNPQPSVSPTHPNCRDVIVTLMPGFGFDESGKIIYKGRDPETGEPWDEYKKQRGG